MYCTTHTVDLHLMYIDIVSCQMEKNTHIPRINAFRGPYHMTT